jgi:hypothetical protein
LLLSRSIALSTAVTRWRAPGCRYPSSTSFVMTAKDATRRSKRTTTPPTLPPMSPAALILRASTSLAAPPPAAPGVLTASHVLGGEQAAGFVIVCPGAMSVCGHVRQATSSGQVGSPIFASRRDSKAPRPAQTARARAAGTFQAAEEPAAPNVYAFDATEEHQGPAWRTERPVLFQ